MPLYSPASITSIDQIPDVQFGSGVTPTVDQQVNLDVLTPSASTWYARLGNFVYVNTMFQVQATAPGACSFRVSLPVGMQDFTNINQLIGGGFSSPDFGDVTVFAISEWQSDSVFVRWDAADTSLRTVVWTGYFLS